MNRPSLVANDTRDGLSCVLRYGQCISVTWRNVKNTSSTVTAKYTFDKFST